MKKMKDNNKKYEFSLMRLFLIWVKIGCTSFGGGAITQFQIQENFIYKYKWITAEEYTNIIAIGQLSPGINIFAHTILVGKRLAGWKGIFLSMAGLVIPSATITVILTTVYRKINKFDVVNSALKTMFAAIYGVTLATLWRNIYPIVKKNYKKGKLALTVTLGMIVTSSILFIFFKPSVFLLYLFGALSGTIVFKYLPDRHKEGGE